MKKLIFGILVSAIFIYFSFRGVDYEKILEELKDVRHEFLLPSIMFLILASFLRSLRWGIVLSPIEKIDQKRLYPIVCVGYMAVVLIPMRMGEFIRPYLITVKSRVPLSSSLATVFVERVLDVLSILGILFFLILSSSLPPWLIKTGYSILLTFILLVFFMYLLYFKTEFALRLLSPILNRFPRKLRKRVDNLIRTFVKGFYIISEPKRLACTVILSILIWIASGFSIYSLFYFQNIQLPIISAFVVLIVTIIGISLPAAPGMIGNFQFASIVALSFFGIHKSDAFVFSMVNYLIGIGVPALLGLVFLPFLNVSFEDIKKDFVGYLTLEVK